MSNHQLKEEPPMQVFGLPGYIIRTARVASRLIDAKTPDIAVAIRRDALGRWYRARQQGLSANAAAQAVGVPAQRFIAGSMTLNPRAGARTSSADRPGRPGWLRPSKGLSH